MPKYIIRSSDSFIRHDKQTNKYVEVKNGKYAAYWNEKIKAERVRNNLKASLRTKYWVEEIEMIESKPAPSNITDSVNKTKLVSDEDISRWYECISTFIDFSDCAADKRELFKSRLSDAEKEICDIYHYIELSDNLNAYQGWLAYKKLQQSLRFRRKVKRELEVLNKICELNGSPMIAKLKEGENLSYRPRILHTLFENGGIKIEH